MQTKSGKNTDFIKIKLKFKKKVKFMYLNRKSKKILDKNPYVGEKIEVALEEKEGDGIEIEKGSSSSSDNSDKEYADMLDPNALSEDDSPVVGSKRSPSPLSDD